MKTYIYLIAPAIGLVLAQLIKFIFVLRKDGITLSDAFASGGMPSSHTAGMAALTTTLGIDQGVANPIFGLAATLLVIIIYDSVGVRRTAGESSIAIKEVEQSLKLRPRQKVHIMRGHTPSEAFGGVILGVIIAFILTKVLLKS